MIDVFVADEQDAHPVDLERFGSLARGALEEEGLTGVVEVSLIFQSEAAMSELNKEFMGKEGPTDVLSFPIDDEPVAGGRFPDAGSRGPGDSPEPEMPRLVGDIVICPAVAHRNAIEHERNYDDEVALLVVHGALHLLGWDHVIDSDAEKMEAREREILRRRDRSAS